MPEVMTHAPVSSARRVTPTDLAHAQTAAQLAVEERHRRREALLHSLELARQRRRRRLSTRPA